jgi:hypothetical protein
MRMKTKQKTEKAEKKKPAKKEQKTVVAPNEYNGNKMFSIFKESDVDEDGKPEPDAYPKFSCGIGKAKHIVNHIEELKKFVEENG